MASPDIFPYVQDPLTGVVTWLVPVNNPGGNNPNGGSFVGPILIQNVGYPGPVGVINYNALGLRTYTVGPFNPVQIGYGGSAGVSSNFFEIIQSDDTLSFGTVITGLGLATENLWNNVHFANGIPAQGSLAFNLSRGTVNAPTALQLNDSGGIALRGNPGTALTGWTDDSANVRMIALENWSAGHNGSAVQMQVTAVGASYTTRTTMFDLRSTGVGIGMAPNTQTEISSNAAIGAYGAAGSFTTTGAGIIDFASGTNEMRIVSAGPAAALQSNWIGNAKCVVLSTTAFALQAGVLLTVGTAGPLITSSVALTNNAGANTGTLTNSPATGNPTKWIPINDNGTTRNIPAW